jgi:hypothetical protein
MANWNMKTFFAFVAGLFLWTVFASCISKNRDQGPLFLDYRITAEEGNDSVSVLISFHEDNFYGAVVAIDNPGYVMLDGVRISPDNSSITGPFYPAFRAVKSFKGRHSILYVSSDGIKVEQSFSFQPFSIVNPLPDTISKQEFTLGLAGVNSGDMVRVLMTDTTFPGEGVERIDSAFGKKVTITAADLSKLEAGPVQLELSRETRSNISSKEAITGICSIVFTIRREIFIR